MRMLTVLVALLPLTVFASPKETAKEGVKVGVIDFEKLFTETKTARVDKAELDRLLTTKQNEVDLRKTTLQKARTELVAAAKTMDAVARARREAELDAETAALKKLFEEAQSLVNARERELSARVVNDAKLIAPEVAKQKGILLVLGAAEALFWTAPSVVQVDLTAEIARALDQRLALKTTR